MNFKDMLSKISQLSEATTKTKTGVKHTGKYGNEVDANSEDTPKKKRGGQEKDEGPKFDVPKGDLFGRTSGTAPKGKPGTKVTKMADADKAEKKAEKAEKKKGLKEWLQVAEATMPGAQLNVKPMPGASQLTDPSGKVVAQGPADKIKAMQASMANGEVTMPGMTDEMEEGLGDSLTRGFNKFNDKMASVGANLKGAKANITHNPKDYQAAADAHRNVMKRNAGAGEIANRGSEAAALSHDYKKGRAQAGIGRIFREADAPPNDSDMGAGLGAGRSQSFEGKDEGKPGKNFAKIAKSAGKEYGSKAAGERVAGAVKAKLAKQGKLEEAKPDFLDMDKDGDKKEPMKKAIADKKKTKVKEGMESRLKAAHHAGKSHALGKQGYNCAYDDMEEARQYHEGYKLGLDECYGQAPIMGYMGEETPNAVVDNMASYGAYDDADEMDEGNAFTGALSRTPTGGQFKVGGKQFTDRSSIEEDPVFESWDKQLNSLIEEYSEITEGLSVSISKGNEGAPDSVSVTAQDGEADQLLGLLKQAGLGLFGGDDVGQAQPGHSSPMSVAVDGEPETSEIGVVDDHDGMMDLIKKVTGGEAGQPSGGEITVSSDEEGEDTSDEEGHDHEHTDEETCNECGMMEADCGCDHTGDTGSKEQVEEVESEDQMTYQMAEDNPPDSGAAEVDAEDADISADNAAASSHGGAMNSNLEEEGEPGVEESEDDLEESLANGADDQFEADIDFMTNVISGGLNGKKTTGQSTIPVVASQENRLGNPMQESVNLLTDWKALAGIK